MTDPAEAARDSRAPDPAAAVETIMAWLDRWGLDAIPHGPIPPADEDALAAARAEAERAAADAGRLNTLRELRHAIIEWALGRYRQAGLHAVYFSGSLEPPEERRQAIEVLLDAATGHFLADVLSDEAATTLLDRLEVYLGEPLFRPENGS
ncbi:MAG: hypothetical protein Q7S35_05890 [Candidatus Limnocylindrales bacterium]|nr:hypothetical protein [Candidatus Limnocylindrales bacterium]